MSDEPERWNRWIAGLRGNDHAAVHEFWEQYGPHLERLAGKHLADALRRRVSPEDVAQSACRTFLRRARVGQFQLSDSESLWRLLCAITLTKIREQTRFHLRQKRALGVEVSPRADGDSGLHPVAPGPTPADAAEFADQFERLLASLDDEERRIVDMKLQDYTHEEVAAALGCSERTVRRLLKGVKARLARLFDVAAE